MIYACPGRTDVRVQIQLHPDGSGHVDAAFVAVWIVPVGYRAQDNAVTRSLSPWSFRRLVTDSCDIGVG